MMENLTETLLTYKSAIVAGWIALFFAVERLRPAAIVPLGRSERMRRLISNGGLFGANIAVSLLIVVPVSLWAASVGPEWRESLAPWWQGGWGLVFDLLLLDFLIYWWHRANHRVPFLWRFHEIHHLDETLDSTTAIRFHWGEVALSACARAVFIIVFDIPLESVLIFEIQVLLAAIFAHSNVRLPNGVERAIGWIFVTPAIHWVHHHAVRRDTDSNYGNLFSFWDRMFGSFSPNRREPDMKIGVERESERSFWHLMVRPFERRIS
ncbi:MAG: sterol desaturase family protein [Alphaproteobacteria bacterium]|nr:sterol desaturase family protein [Alphaproteobacteria bacterium]